MTRERIVFLCRSGDESDAYEAALEEAGYRAISIPVLRFEMVNQKDLRDALEHSQSYDGLIFTSPRAVEAMASAMPWLPTENVLWHMKPIFAVGPKTASELRRIGFEPTGEDSGTAAMLFEHIAARRFERPLLFLCGSRRRPDLPDSLREAGIKFDELCVYETHPRKDLEFQAHPAPDWVVFFSPSGVEAVVEDGSLDISAARIAAIGETTADALRAFKVHAVARTPTPDALVDAVTATDTGD